MVCTHHDLENESSSKNNPIYWGSGVVKNTNFISKETHELALCALQLPGHKLFLTPFFCLALLYTTVDPSLKSNGRLLLTVMFLLAKQKRYCYSDIKMALDAPLSSLQYSFGALKMVHEHDNTWYTSSQLQIGCNAAAATTLS